MASFHYSIKSGKKGSARRHATYIERQGAHSTQGDLIHSSHGSMPDWAAGDPGLFWSMADRHERANGAAYREHEIALPNELSVPQLVDLAERLVGNLVGNRPYQYAIHAPEGKLGGIQNPHVHLMCSDRIPDGINRSPERTFSRYNAKQPSAGGCRKDSGGKTPMELKQQVTAARKLVAETQNQMLAEYGHDVRVDHRSLRDQGVQRRAERHLGQCFIEGMADAEKAQYAECRAGGTAVDAQLNC
ncbi:MobA/MobL family protein [Xanthomonas nasturtii]|uniref:MobA/MobL family protein n=1 Tax=Xanthomonas nasturtii TaxID=1843581 RepID=A0ABT0LWM4_9XANT|nr:MobA/MobL family protein [Xanthomonas nasturtii]MCL1553743.1 MobA/MobL family protein [Xanthomonas nasturtii]MCL1557720.1 MobA/MobL family protein [Xanthomonas nasturtii]